MKYEWKQRTYSNAHLIREDGKPACRRVIWKGKWLNARAELTKCADCLKQEIRFKEAAEQAD